MYQNYIFCSLFRTGYATSSPYEINVSTIQVNQSHYRPEVPRGFQEVKVPTLRDSGTGLW